MDFDLDRTIAVLERTPGVLKALISGLGPELTRGGYGEGAWSAYEVVGHLIVGEREDWIARAKIILEQGVSRPFDPFPHDAAIHPDSGRELDQLLDEFTRLRAANLEALRSFRLGPAQLALRGTHPALGEVTLAQLLATWATHDLHHIRQICKAMAWQWRDLVGPWRHYLNTLSSEQRA
ncbi:MAG: DinB family protein [Phycisphaerales bacterium]|nr:DinB family protein [Phycisphaerales bacterium]